MDKRINAELDENGVFINISGPHAQLVARLQDRASNCYARKMYPNWFQTLSAINEAIFHKCSPEDSKILDTLNLKCCKLETYYFQVMKMLKQQEGSTPRELNLKYHAYIAAIRGYSRFLQIQLDKQGYYPDKKALDDTSSE